MCIRDRDRACGVEETPIWRIAPTPFDPRLVESAREASVEAGGGADELTSGALHDAASVARVRPAAMLFAPSLGGISHAAEEDTSEEDLALAIEAFGALADRVVAS